MAISQDNINGCFYLLQSSKKYVHNHNQKIIFLLESKMNSGKINSKAIYSIFHGKWFYDDEKLTFCLSFPDVIFWFIL